MLCSCASGVSKCRIGSAARCLACAHEADDAKLIVCDITQEYHRVVGVVVVESEVGTASWQDASILGSLSAHMASKIFSVPLDDTTAPEIRSHARKSPCAGPGPR